MRVAVIPGGFSPKSGGAYTFEQELLKALAVAVPASPHDFVVFGGTPEPNAPKNLLQIPLSKGEKAWAKLQAAQRDLMTCWGRRRRCYGVRPHWLEPWLHRHRIDFVWHLFPGTVCVDIPYLMTIWDLQHRLQPFFPEVSHGREWETRDLRLSYYLRRATGVITGTEVGRQEIHRYFQVDPQRIHPIPHPVPCFQEELAASPQVDVLKKFQLEPGFLFYPAQLWPHKNHATLIESLKLLRDDYSQRRVLVCSGSDKGNRAYLEALARKLGVQDQLRFLGFVSRQELVGLYRQAVALTYVTHFGPENLPPLEAFALECPVVASRVAGAEEQYGDCVVYVDPCDAGSIAKGIAQVCHDETLRQSLIARGKVRATQGTPRQFVGQVLKVIDQFVPLRRCWPGSG